jgi:hypothetical protein
MKEYIYPCGLAWFVNANPSPSPFSFIYYGKLILIYTFLRDVSQQCIDNVN